MRNNAGYLKPSLGGSLLRYYTFPSRLALFKRVLTAVLNIAWLRLWLSGWLYYEYEKYYSVWFGPAPQPVTARGGLHIVSVGQITNGFVQELLFSGIAFGLRELEFKWLIHSLTVTSSTFVPSWLTSFKDTVMIPWYSSFMHHAEHSVTCSK